jgi:hypothetical protein
MAPNDPRLKKLAQNVDDGIIEPLEAYQRSLQAVDQISTPPIMEKEAPEEEAMEESTDEATVEENLAPALEAAAEQAPKPKPEENLNWITNPAPSKPIIKIVGNKEKQVELLLPKDNSLQVGDRLFLREPPSYIRIPGTGEDILNSEGEITGLVEINAIEGLKAQGTVLSGVVPKDGIAEKTQ